MKLPAAFLSWLENMLNGYIALDPEFPRRLDVLQAKTFRVQISGMNLDVYMTIAQRRIRLYELREVDPDVTLRGTPLALLNLLRTDDPMTLVQQGQIELGGDVQLARALKNIFDSLDIDWEEKVARMIGDWPAHQIGIFTRRFKQWNQRSHESVQRSAGEYLQEESRLLPARIEIENFIADVDALREAVDRLEARIIHMQTGGTHQ
jgi:ubiquinone biosynthesis accessory factor UbiJ